MFLSLFDNLFIKKLWYETNMSSDWLTAVLAAVESKRHPNWLIDCTAPSVSLVYRIHHSELKRGTSVDKKYSLCVNGEGGM